MIPIYPARCLCVRRQLPLPSSYKFPFWTSRSTTETVEMSSSPWRNFRHWLHRKWPKWQPSVQPVAKNSSTCRHFRASDRTTSPFFFPKSGEMCCVSSSLHRDVHTYFPLKTIIRLQNYQNKIKLQLSLKEACRWPRYWLFLNNRFVHDVRMLAFRTQGTIRPILDAVGMKLDVSTLRVIVMTAYSPHYYFCAENSPLTGDQ